MATRENKHGERPESAGVRQQRLPLAWDGLEAPPPKQDQDGDDAAKTTPVPAAAAPAPRERSFAPPAFRPPPRSPNPVARSLGSIPASALGPAEGEDGEREREARQDGGESAGTREVVRLEDMPTSLGQRLLEARGSRNLSIAQVTQTTKIQKHFLEAVEADCIRELPPPVYTRSYIQQLCRLYGIPAGPLLAEYRRAVGEGPAENSSRSGGFTVHARGEKIASIQYRPPVQLEGAPGRLLHNFSRVAVLVALGILVAIVLSSFVVIQVHNLRLRRAANRAPDTPGVSAGAMMLEPFIISQQLPLEVLPIPERK